jgi:hypothetical protein
MVKSELNHRQIQKLKKRTTKFFQNIDFEIKKNLSDQKLIFFQQ